MRSSDAPSKGVIACLREAAPAKAGGSRPTKLQKAKVNFLAKIMLKTPSGGCLSCTTSGSGQAGRQGRGSLLFASRRLKFHMFLMETWTGLEERRFDGACKGSG